MGHVLFRNMLSHSGELIPGIGAMMMDGQLHMANMIKYLVKRIAKALYWFMKPQPIRVLREYFLNTFLIPTAKSMLSLAIGLDTVFDKDLSQNMNLKK